MAKEADALQEEVAEKRALLAKLRDAARISKEEYELVW